jgi:microcystin-dependent protein
MDPFIGQIDLVGFNFAPRGWALCNGQLLPIAQNTALFSLLGTTYGGNGTTNFALPDLRGRVPVGQGTGSSLSNVALGEQDGRESVTLISNQIPPHTHALSVSSDPGTTSVPANNTVLAQTLLDDGTPLRAYSSSAPNTTLAASSVANTGGGQPLPIRNPYLGLNYIIALQGIFPSRN